MAQEEKYGNRDLTYSAWHRRRSTGRFVGIENAQLLAMIDADVHLFVEYDDGTKEPIALIEEARDVGQVNKPATVTANLAKRARIPAYVVLWTPDELVNPAAPDLSDIASFRVQRLWPFREYQWRSMTPREYAEALLKMRTWQSGELQNELFEDL